MSNNLGGVGDAVLIFPKTEKFSSPLPEFSFSGAKGMRLWVLPFCLESNKLLLPKFDQENGQPPLLEEFKLESVFESNDCVCK